MILPNSTESEILESLMQDHIALKPIIRKWAKKYIKECLKKGKNYQGDNIVNTFRLATGNVWAAILRFGNYGNSNWCCMKYCIAEGNYRTKDYYFLRGLTDNKPYYVKMSTHTIKRFLERAFHYSEEEMQSDSGQKAIDIADAFELHEIAISVKEIPLDLLHEYCHTEGTENDFSKIRVIANISGMFFATKSKEGNYNTKTFISMKEILNANNKDNDYSEPSEQLLKILVLQKVHLYYNPTLWHEREKKLIYKLLGEYDSDYSIGENGISLLKP